MSALIVEDELMIASDIEAMLSDFGYGDAIITTNYTEAIDAFQGNTIDFALLDIQLSGHKTGIDVAHYIRDNHKIPFIFLSSYEDMPTVGAALATAPHAYLQKPFGKASLYAALQLALTNYNKAGNKEATEEDAVVIKDAFFVKGKNGFTRVNVPDILYIKSDGNYLELHTVAAKHLVRESQKNIISSLPPQFLKVHKSFIVNLPKVMRLDAASLQINDTEIPVAPNYRDALMASLKTFS